ncbi:hypothetical protein T09_3581 [Trichinella sp. T9]|nr:hypothetical protein T09_3581 [Trichinella sp. T9]
MLPCSCWSWTFNQCPENSLTLNDGHLRKCQEQFKSFLPQDFNNRPSED